MRTKENKLPALLDRGYLPPQEIEIEQAVLGAIMLEKDAIVKVSSNLKPETFYKESHGFIYLAIQKLYNQGQPIDLLTVTAKLREDGKLEAAGGAYYITELTSRVQSAANIEYHTKILQELALKRSIIQLGAVMQRDGYANETDCFDILEMIQKGLLDMLSVVDNGKMRDLQGGIQEVLESIDLKISKQSGLTGINSGLLAVNALTGGWQSPDLIIVAARPGMGKTALALKYARGAAMAGHNVAIFSLEMSYQQLIMRLMAQESKTMAVGDLSRGRLSREDLAMLITRIDALYDYKIHIDDTASISTNQLRSKAFKLKQEIGLDLIIVDYLQLMTADGKGNREQEISSISRSLKRLAKELDVPVIALSQLSRSVETRGGNARPKLSDLRESGAIEQDADIVQFIHRPEYYGHTTDADGNSLKGVAELIFAKHRNGSIDDVLVKFQPHFTDFQDLEFEQPTYEIAMPSGEDSWLNDDQTDEPEF